MSPPAVTTEEVQSVLWYHTIDLGHGIVTPGWFDLRPVVAHMPWPDVRGKRCLDIGTYDGFLAFELERRGAAQVIAIDIADHTLWDWPPDVRATGAENLTALAGPEKGAGFAIAKRALGSRVEREVMSVYDLTPERPGGTFDVITCGSLLLHLRDPMRALEAILTVCQGRLLSSETINLGLTALLPRTPVLGLNGSGELCQWFTPNAAGHRRMLFAAGFAIERSSRPYTIPYGIAHAARATGLRSQARAALQRILAGGPGVPHVASLARPRL
jgi:tRNA (mo5U34)-methyltransferase